jgi:pantothenate synthetase
LSTYPRTISTDITSLNSLEKPISALFLPKVETIYPSGIDQDVSKQVGTFVEVEGLQKEMEGKSRPTFFRGVATVVNKLWNIIEVSLISRQQQNRLERDPYPSKKIPARSEFLWSKRYSTSPATS